MQMQLTIDSELLHFDLPPAVHFRLQELLDRQDQGQELTQGERSEAEGLIELAEFLSLIRLRAKRITKN
ncbi:hypothetical protein MNBD_CHLOROFLEXI01-4364 [hydrothermal vent metagenome]|uniref:Uncharacterized protein n=1 Tax=hydrothermal vent metagenome TaxID=652676 RepID=A0A3B0V8Y5_9ZZZZ